MNKLYAFLFLLPLLLLSSCDSDDDGDVIDGQGEPVCFTTDSHDVSVVSDDKEGTTTVTVPAGGTSFSMRPVAFRSSIQPWLMWFGDDTTAAESLDLDNYNDGVERDWFRMSYAYTADDGMSISCNIAPNTTGEERKVSLRFLGVSNAYALLTIVQSGEE